MIPSNKQRSAVLCRVLVDESSRFDDRRVCGSGRVQASDMAVLGCSTPGPSADSGLPLRVRQSLLGCDPGASVVGRSTWERELFPRAEAVVTSDEDADLLARYRSSVAVQDEVARRMGNMQELVDIYVRDSRLLFTPQRSWSVFDV